MTGFIKLDKKRFSKKRKEWPGMLHVPLPGYDKEQALTFVGENYNGDAIYYHSYGQWHYSFRRSSTGEVVIKDNRKTL